MYKKVSSLSTTDISKVLPKGLGLTIFRGHKLLKTCVKFSKYGRRLEHLGADTVWGENKLYELF